MYKVYILQSQKIKRFYIGSTGNLENRLSSHNKGSTKSTKPYRPWRVIYSENYGTKSEAAKREYFLKHPAGYLEKKRIIEQYSDTGGVA